MSSLRWEHHTTAPIDAARMSMEDFNVLQVNLVSPTTYAVCVNFVYEWWTV